MGTYLKSRKQIHVNKHFFIRKFYDEQNDPESKHFETDTVVGAAYWSGADDGFNLGYELGRSGVESGRGWYEPDGFWLGLTVIMVITMIGATIGSCVTRM